LKGFFSLIDKSNILGFGRKRKENQKQENECFFAVKKLNQWQKKKLCKVFE